jgi:hypothetical protein
VALEAVGSRPTTRLFSFSAQGLCSLAVTVDALIAQRSIGHLFLTPSNTKKSFLFIVFYFPLSRSPSFRSLLCDFQILRVYDPFTTNPDCWQFPLSNQRSRVLLRALKLFGETRHRLPKFFIRVVEFRHFQIFERKICLRTNTLILGLLIPSY